MGARRDNGAGSVTFDHRGTDCRDSRYHKSCKGRWVAKIRTGRDDSGKLTRATLTAPTKAKLDEKVKKLQADRDQGLDVARGYTVGQALEEFLEHGLEGLAPNTVTAQHFNTKLLTATLGSYQLREMTANQALAGLKVIAQTHSSESMGKIKNTLERAIRLAQVNDKVGRNVAQVIKAPAGQKESKQRQAFSQEEMLAILKAAVGYRNMDAFIHLSFLTGASPDEVRGLHWSEIDDLDALEPGFDVTRTHRHSGGTKTPTRRRGLGIPQASVLALKRHRKVQAADRLRAGAAWQDNDLVFTTLTGRLVSQHYMRKAFRAVLKKAKVEGWENRVPYEMRHTYAFLMGENEVTAEEVAQQLGHSRSSTYELVYRHVLKPRRRKGQGVMDTIVPAAEA